MNQMSCWRGAALAVLALGGAAAAQTSLPTLNLTVNGRPFAKKAVVIQGEAYVPLSAVKAAGVNASTFQGQVVLGKTSTAPGGANARISTEGCLNELLFDGVWRLRVREVKLLDRAWGVTVELRNGTSKTLTPTDAGVDLLGQDLSLILADDNTLSMDVSDSPPFTTGLSMKRIAPGASAVYTVPFRGSPNDLAQRPVKLLFGVEAKAGLPFSSSPSFRVNLTCRQ